MKEELFQMASNPNEDDNVTYVFKPIGWGPKQCINKLKELPEYKGKKLAFAGRLDPMACGLLPIMHHMDGKERNDAQNDHQDSFKTYRFNVILGVQSDTYDILGLVNHRVEGSYPMNLDDIIKKIDRISKITEQAYPPYSSKSVFSHKYGENGKMVPLWLLAKEGNLPDELPKHDIVINKFELLSTKEYQMNTLHQIIKARVISLPIDSDFRQVEILKRWEDIISKKESYLVLKCEANVSVGTYIRGIANDLGGVCFDIFRTEVKDMKLENPDEWNLFDFSIVK